MERGYYDQTLFAAAEQRERELSRRTRKRFLHALLYAVVVYLLLAAFVGSMTESFKGSKNVSVSRWRSLNVKLVLTALAW